MQLIAGLGNPGDEHKNQRHNIGFMAADAIASRHRFPAFRPKYKGLIAEGEIAGEKVLLLKPQTYMNASGESIEAVMQFYKLTPADLTVIYDELDLLPGKSRIKTGGGNGGHNGLRSIDPRIGPNYRRIRLGIGHPGHKDAVIHHVLANFSKADRDWLDPLLETLADNIGMAFSGDESGLMNKLAIAVNGDGAERDERPRTPDPTRKKAPAGQSHIRAARTKPLDVEPPTKGPMAAMLAKVFGKKDDDTP